MAEHVDDGFSSAHPQPRQTSGPFDNYLSLTEQARWLGFDGHADDQEYWLRRAVEAGEEDAVVELVRLLRSQDRADEAESWLRRRASRGDGAATAELARHLAWKGDLDQAERWLRTLPAAAQGPAAVDVARPMLARDQAAEAERWLRPAAEAGSIEACRLIAEACLTLSQTDEAERFLAVVASRGGFVEQLRARMTLAELLVARGQLAEAESWLRGFDHSEPREALIRLLAGAGRMTEAVEVVAERLVAGEYVSDDIALVRQLDGAAELERSLRPLADDGHAEARAQLGSLYVSLGRFQDAYLQVQPVGAMSRVAAQTLIDAFIALGRHDEAEEWLREHAEHGNLGAAERLAKGLIEAGRADEAEDRLRRLAEAGHQEAFAVLSSHFRDQRSASLRPVRPPAGPQHLYDAVFDPPAMAAARAAIDVVTVVTTAVVTSAIVPFLQSFMAEAGKDAYNTARDRIRRLFRRADKKHAKKGTKSGPDDAPVRQLLIVQDPKLPVSLHVSTDLPDEAIDALARLNVDNLAGGAEDDDHLHVMWDRSNGSWRAVR